MLYEVIEHSVTAQARGFDHEGNEGEGRHWKKGAIIDLGKDDARSLLAAKAVQEATAKPSTQPASEGAPKSDGVKDQKAAK